MQKSGFQLILFLFFAAFTQAGSYEPIDTANLETRKKCSEHYQQHSNEILKSLAGNLKGKEAALYRDFYKEQQKTFREEILRGDYLFDGRFSSFTDSIVKRILSANPDLPADLLFYYSRNISLNATSFGDKTFAINLGSYYYLDNEQQLAAMIAHEIAHYRFDHVREVWLSRHRTSKENAKNSLKQIRKTRYGRGNKALEHYRELLYADGALNQRQEFEADSLGYQLYKNAGYKPTEYLNLYQLMALYDTINPTGVETDTYRKYFNLPTQAFREEWLKSEDFSRYDYSLYKAKINEDSVGTHPQLKARIGRLTSMYPELAHPDSSSAGSPGFKQLSDIARYERLQSLDYNEDYGTGLYLCLLGLQHNDPDSTFLHRYMAKFLQKITDARASYTLNRYVDRVDPVNQSPSYQQFLNFIWNLKMNELKLIASHWNTTTKP